MRLSGILQWMQRPFADILHLYRMLFNEEAARTLSAVKKKYATKVVIYTRRPSLLYYSSCFRPDKLITLRFWWASSLARIPPALAAFADASVRALFVFCV
jgi:hypothetical protein